MISFDIVLPLLITNWTGVIKSTDGASMEQCPRIDFFFFCRTGQSSVETCRWMSSEKISISRREGKWKKNGTIYARLSHHSIIRPLQKLPRKYSRMYSICTMRMDDGLHLYTFVHYIYAMIWGRARRVGWLDRRDIGGAGGTIHHTAETSRHIAGSDVMLEISTNNLYADVSARSRFAGLPIRNNKLTPLRDCGYTCATRTRADMSYWRLVPFFVNLI